MKYLLTLIVVCLMFVASANAVDIKSIFGVGTELVDGGQGHLKFFAASEAAIKSDTASGFVNKLRGTYSFLKNGDNPEQVQRLELWDITQKRVSRELWDWYFAVGFMVLESVVEDEAALNEGRPWKFETGFYAFRKVDVGIGVDFIPVDGRGDKVFIYGLLNFKL